MKYKIEFEIESESVYRQLLGTLLGMNIGVVFDDGDPVKSLEQELIKIATEKGIIDDDWERRTTEFVMDVFRERGMMDQMEGFIGNLEKFGYKWAEENKSKK